MIGIAMLPRPWPDLKLGDIAMQLMVVVVMLVEKDGNFVKCVIFLRRRIKLTHSLCNLAHAWCNVSLKLLRFDTITYSKHRKNCECCPGHYLIVNHYSAMS